MDMGKLLENRGRRMNLQELYNIVEQQVILCERRHQEPADHGYPGQQGQRFLQGNAERSAVG